jgi:hypothetical protein
VKTGFKTLTIGLASLCFAVVAQAGTVNILPNVNGTTQQIWAVNSAATTGATMVGMQVTVTFADSSTQTLTWGATGFDTGQVSGAAGNGTWTLSVTGNTGDRSAPAPFGAPLTPWVLTSTSTNLAISSIVLDGTGGSSRPGGTIFDRDPSDNGSIGTPNSAFGIDYRFNTETGVHAPFTVNVTYSNIVALFGANQGCDTTSPFSANSTVTGCGDEWAKLTFAFTGNQFVGTGGGPATWRYFQDSDTIGAPEPLTMGLMGAGLLCLAAYRRRRSSAQSN